MIYVASPYTHEDKSIENERFHKVMEYVAHMTNEGAHVFSPILHFHPTALRHVMRTDWEFYWKYNLEMMMFCSHINILLLDGWKESKGVKAELDWWKKYKCTDPRFIHF